MSWLAAHIWLELLLAALLGGAIGWALRAREGDQIAVADEGQPDAARITTRQLREMEEQLAAGQEEVARLHEKLKKAKADTDDEGSVLWRNRYLESRVRFLEGKVADLEDVAARPPEDKDDLVTRLRWRNTYLEGRIRYLEEELVRGGVLPDTTPPPAAAAPPPNQLQPAAPPASPPPRLTHPRDHAADDLKRIAGVGPKIEQKLNALGIYHYDQIAAWTPQEIEWVNREISFKGRIERENWVGQAASLAGASGVDPQGQEQLASRPG